MGDSTDAMTAVLREHQMGRHGCTCGYDAEGQLLQLQLPSTRASFIADHQAQELAAARIHAFRLPSAP